VDLSGTLASPDQVRVSSEANGVIERVNAELGQEVQAGQVLIQLDTRELELALVRAESALRQTEAQLGIDSARSDVVPPDDQIASVRTATANRDDARAQHARAQELVSKGLLPQAEMDTTDTRLKVTEAALQSAIENVRALKASLRDRRAAYELAQKEVNDASIRAPVAGAIAERLVQRGESIREGTHVVTIVQLNPLRLQTAVQEKYANIIRRNLEVQFRVEPYPDQMFTGRIANISPSINQQSRTFPVEVLVENPSRKLKPGFFAKGAILTNVDEDVMAVPQAALSVLAGVASVYVIEDGVVRQQNVSLGAQSGSMYEVVSGLEGDEILATSNLNQIVTGTRVATGGEEGGSPTRRTPSENSGQRGRQDRSGQGGTE
jgi:RND family efflux transporter MFP subunit